MEWSNDLVLEFIRLYEMHPVLWNPEHPLNKNRTSLNDAWIKMAEDFSIDVTVDQLRKKKESVLAMYRTITNKIRKWEVRKEKYVPSWFAYDAIHKFMSTIKKRKKEPKQVFSQDIQVQDQVKNELFDESEDVYDLEETYDEYEVPRIQPMSVSVESDYVASEPKQRDVETQEHRTRKRPKLEDGREQFQEAPDSCELYAQLLATKLRGLPERSRLVLQNKIDNLVFQAELKELDRMNNAEYHIVD
ncbi:uncharacterized protein LOC132700408 [Cylas formicarius]|uniref:uncharacterized protein LOC132700408 n=1 Tax=Cylas formicarius TaxID=197179 RepID=UPI00295896B2|nr:uncharacterized protein LOC132700408 [Cylas formicarius]